MSSCEQFRDFTPAQLTYLTTTLANALAEGLDNDTVAMLSSFFFGIGSALGLIARQRELIEGCKSAAPRPCGGRDPACQKEDGLPVTDQKELVRAK